MRTIAHISDLHFGTVEAPIAEGLIAHLNAQPPSLLIVSGDLTQRARRWQFRAAHVFLERIHAPRLVIPGNHDVPLFDVVRRFASPLGRYRDLISADLDPTFCDDEIFVAGINTARSFTWKAGRVSSEQIEQLQARLEAAGTRFKIVVTHHPFIPSPMSPETAIDLGRAAETLPILEAGGVALLLAGHLHHGYAGDTRAHYPRANRSMLSVQAGTAISHRVRHEPNAFNWITVDDTAIEIDVRAWNGLTFESLRRQRYSRVTLNRLDGEVPV